MICFFLCLLIVLGFVLPKSKIVQALFLIVIYSIYALSFDGWDYYNYMAQYDTIASGGDSVYELLFVKSFLLISKSGVDFFGARCIYYLFTVCILVYSVNKLTDYPNPVWACYLIFSSFPDGPLIRNTMAMSISLLAISIVIDNFRIKRILLAICLLICASLFHSSYWILLFGIIPMVYFYRGMSERCFVGLFIIFFIIFTALPSVVFDLFSKLTIRENVIEKYQTGMYANTIGTLYNVLKYLLIILPVVVCFKIKGLSESKKAVFIYYISLSFAIVLIVQNFAVNYSRLFRLLLLLVYIFCSNNIYQKGYNSKLFASVGMIGYSVIFACLFYFFEAKDTIYTIWNMHFETNLLFNIIRI